MNLENYMKKIPLELYVKIIYKSGLCSKEAQIIKNMNNSLIIPFDNVIYNKNGNTYINHLINMNILKKQYFYIEYIYFIG